MGAIDYYSLYYIQHTLYNIHYTSTIYIIHAHCMYYVVCVDSTLLLNEVEMRYNLYNVHRYGRLYRTHYIVHTAQNNH